MRTNEIGRLLQAIAMGMVLFALGIGIFERSMSGELTFLFIAIAIFYIGWLLTRRKP